MNESGKYYCFNCGKTFDTEDMLRGEIRRTPRCPICENYVMNYENTAQWRSISMEQAKLVNYENEARKLDYEGKSSSEWFNPQAGSFEIEFMDELHEKIGRGFKGEEVMKLFVKLKVTGVDEISGEEFKGKEMLMSCTKTYNVASQSGQLIVLAKARGTLKGTKASLSVIQDGKRRKFVYLEAQTLINAEKRSRQKGAKAPTGLDITQSKVEE